MVIGVDARATVSATGGRGRVVSELVGRFATLSRGDPALKFRLYTGETGASIPRSAGLEECRIAKREPWWHLAVAADADRTCDVFISTNSYLTVRFLRIPTVAVVYDMITFTRGARPRLRSRLIERLTLRGAVRNSAKVVAISSATASDLAHVYGFAADKTVVVPQAANEVFTPRKPDAGDEAVLVKHGLGNQFVLITGTLEPRKNLPRLIEAYKSLGEALRAEYPLVVVGREGWDTGEIRASIASIDRHVRRLGYVSDEDLAALYRNCTVFCFPSLYEGFGLPVLEAMQCGAPVLTSNVSSLPEVGGDAARYVDPRSVESIRTSLAEILADANLRRRMSAAGIERSGQFSWERTAEAFVGICREIGPPVGGR